MLSLSLMSLTLLQELVKRMLHIDPHTRLTAAQVLKYQWISQRQQLPHHPLTIQDAQLVKVGTQCALLRGMVLEAR